MKLQATGVRWSLPDAQGRPLWDVRAQSATGVSAQGLAELQDVRCKVFSEGKLAMEANAPRVKADYAGKRLALLGGVAARTTDGKRSFRSAQVSLRVKEKKRAVIEAAGGIRLEVDGMVMTGERLVTDPKLSEGHLYGG